MPSSPYQDAITLLRETQANIEKLSSADGWEVMMLGNHLKTLAKKSTTFLLLSSLLLRSITMHAQSQLSVTVLQLTQR